MSRWCRELEKHLILNSNGLRTFEDARLEVVAYVEAKFALRIRDSVLVDTQIPWMLMLSTLSLSSAKGKWSSSPRDGYIFNETAVHTQAEASNRMAKANRASHGPRVRAKARVKKTRENPKENAKEPIVRTKVPRAHTGAKNRKLVSQVLKTRNHIRNSGIWTCLYQ